MIPVANQKINENRGLFDRIQIETFINKDFYKEESSKEEGNVILKNVCENM